MRGEYERVTRAVSRFRGQWGTYWPFWGFALIGIALAAWEGFSYHNKTTGTVVLARVDDCQVSHGYKGDAAVTCRGTWPVDRRLPAGQQRRHGTIDDADVGDLYRTIKVRIHGGTAYAQTRFIAPAVLFFVGLLFAAGWIYAAWRNAGASRRAAPAAGLPSG